jgi:hypothetical protein
MRIKRYHRESKHQQHAISSCKDGLELKTARGAVLVESKSVPEHRRWLCRAAKK